MIHKTAIVDLKAKISGNVKIGPYCIIGPEVEIGTNSVIHSHVNIVGNTKIGENKAAHAEALKTSPMFNPSNPI